MTDTRAARRYDRLGEEVGRTVFRGGARARIRGLADRPLLAARNEPFGPDLSPALAELARSRPGSASTLSSSWRAKHPEGAWPIVELAVLRAG